MPFLLELTHRNPYFAMSYHDGAYNLMALGKESLSRLFCGMTQDHVTADNRHEASIKVYFNGTDAEAVQFRILNSEYVVSMREV